MGEYVTTSVKLGGKITRSEANALAAHLAERYQFTGEMEADLCADNLNETLIAHEVNYGNIDDIDFPDGITQWEHWVDDCGEGEGITRAIDGVAKYRDAASGLPVFALEEILAVDALASGLGTLIEAAKWWARPLVLEIEG